MISVFVLVATLLTAKKLLRFEQRDLAIFCTIGVGADILRRSFAIRFAVTALLGSIAGTLISSLLTDPIAAALMRMEGISNFSSHPNIIEIIFPAAAVTLMFTVFAYFAGKAVCRFSAVRESD